MDSFTRPERDLNKELKEFIDYVFSFYGDVDPVYPMRKVIGDAPLNKSDILMTTYQKFLREILRLIHGARAIVLIVKE